MQFEQSSLHFTGIHSNLDTDAIVESMSQMQQRPIDNLVKQNKISQNKINAYNEIATSLTNLDTLLQNLMSNVSITNYTATTSNSSAFTATVNSYIQPGSTTNTTNSGSYTTPNNFSSYNIQVTPGNYQVQVQALATNQRNYSAGFSSIDTAGLMGSGTLSIKVGSNTATAFTIDGSTTLESLVGDINDANLGAEASIVYSGSAYYISLSSDDTGTSNAITITDTASTGLANNIAQAAADAVIVLDNYITITRSSNTIDDVLPGVTLNLLETTPNSNTTLTIAADADATAENITTIIDAYNQLITQINNLVSPNAGDNANNPILVGDSILRNLFFNLQNAFGTSFSVGSNPYVGLGVYGITTQSDGTLAFNQSDFAAAVDNDLEALNVVLFGDPNGNVSGVLSLLSQVAENYSYENTGNLQQVNTTIEASIRRNQDRIMKMQNNSISYTKTLQAKFANLELVLGKLETRNQSVQQLSNMRRMWDND